MSIGVLDTERLGGHVSWWLAPAGRWLDVRVATDEGGRTDYASAEDHARGESWMHGDRVYLVEADADAWITAAGLAEVDIPCRVRQRRPDGWLASRDVASAARAAGDADAMSAWCAEHDTRDEDDDVLAFLASVPPPTEAPDVVELVAATVAASTGAVRMSKAQRRKHNRRLAAELRAFELVPNGSVWERAKALASAGLPLTRAELIA